ncbi:phosphotransferase system lactose/cellobiose-specific IIB subunit [Thermoanaerobacter mathranii subsp. mathranii str. A3]|uniref:Phosphotransferase system lactose/cellobiose-specific IIB subunit n=1 Tax=Thermoanaerobacter mathranii subsp. mathranii (strain DSM 11426 / CCUG 53645 / CIP 108742 / A3) TaxID=583358 RepID=A0ABM5LNS5_THEM3|nr:PTS sugar transporter subunit IIB [Thermoanaerobacter mathranii]ADH60398.1 phosphotransferase system lactose/cellobiose-specific IIB subunit [Thermoanaerobacter mathranii subsp. mathranii str. A3]
MLKIGIRGVILCSWGATSSALAKKVTDEAKKQGLDVVVDAGGTGEFKKKAEEYDVALLEPQVRHLKKEIESIASKYNIPVDIVDMQAFAMMDGKKILNQIIELAKKSGKEV